MMGIEAAFSKEFLVDGFMQAPTGVAVFGVPDYKVLAANPFYIRMVDRTESTLLGRPLFSALPEVRKVVEPLFAEIVNTGLPYFGNEVETDLLRQGKIEKTYFNLIYQPVTDEDGKITSIMVVATEVTSLVKARHELQQSEEKFRMLVAQSPIAMAILRGHELVIELANDAILKDIWCRELHEVQGKKLLEVLPELRDQPFPDLLRKVFTSGERHHETEMPVHIEGSGCTFIDFEYRPLFEKDGRVSGVIVTAYDVSKKVLERKKTEENEARLNMVIEASKLGTWELALKTGDFTYSDAYLKTFGVTERLSHQELLDFMDPEDIPSRMKALEEAFVTGWLHYVCRLRWRDGSIHWIEAQGKVIYDENGQPSRLIGTSRDVTEERRFQKSIRESEEKFRLLADSMPQLIWTGDPLGNLNYFNKSVYDYTGLSYKEMHGQGWIEIVHPDDRVMNIRKWREAVKNGGNFLFEHRFRRSNGEYRWQLSRATPQYDAEGNIQRWVGTSTDIHDQKTFARELEEKVWERTRELKKANYTLEKANRELEQFAYIASHDLQEPLRKIQTFADLLKRNIHDEVSAQNYFSKIDTSARRMGELIRSVLEYSRLPSDPGHLMLTDLNEVFENVKTDLELMILEKGAIVESDRLPAIPGMPLQLHQLFSNLIGNSLKFCHREPRIKVSASSVFGEELIERFAADPYKRYLRLEFRDNGIGFDNKYKDQIFTIFQRLHGLQQYSGTGIGLALCKKIVENHLGFITAESATGEGSAFIIFLPA